MKKIKKIVLILVAIIAIILSFIVGNTYAKYMSKVTGKGTADMASWKFKVNEKEDKMQTISLKPILNEQTLSNGKIAPGTEGSFQIKLDATDSEIGINYVIKFENETRKPRNLKFIFDGKTYNSLAELEKVLTGIINANDNDKIKNLTINWIWKYETGNTPQEISLNDDIDTQDVKEISYYAFDILISGTQVIPQD